MHTVRFAFLFPLLTLPLSFLYLKSLIEFHIRAPIYSDASPPLTTFPRPVVHGVPTILPDGRALLHPNFSVMNVTAEVAGHPCLSNTALVSLGEGSFDIGSSVFTTPTHSYMLLSNPLTFAGTSSVTETFNELAIAQDLAAATYLNHHLPKVPILILSDSPLANSMPFSTLIVKPTREARFYAAGSLFVAAPGPYCHHADPFYDPTLHEHLRHLLTPTLPMPQIMLISADTPLTRSLSLEPSLSHLPAVILTGAESPLTLARLHSTAAVVIPPTEYLGFCQPGSLVISPIGASNLYSSAIQLKLDSRSASTVGQIVKFFFRENYHEIESNVALRDASSKCNDEHDLCFKGLSSAPPPGSSVFDLTLYASSDSYDALRAAHVTTCNLPPPAKTPNIAVDPSRFIGKPRALRVISEWLQSDSLCREDGILQILLDGGEHLGLTVRLGDIILPPPHPPAPQVPGCDMYVIGMLTTPKNRLLESRYRAFLPTLDRSLRPRCGLNFVFVTGQPDSTMDGRIVLPVPENMNEGKSLDYFRHAASLFFGTGVSHIYKTDDDVAFCLSSLLTLLSSTDADYIGWKANHAACGFQPHCPPLEDPDWFYTSGAFYGLSMSAAVAVSENEINEEKKVDHEDLMMGKAVHRAIPSPTSFDISCMYSRKNYTDPESGISYPGVASEDVPLECPIRHMQRLRFDDRSIASSGQNCEIIDGDIIYKRFRPARVPWEFGSVFGEGIDL